MLFETHTDNCRARAFVLGALDTRARPMHVCLALLYWSPLHKNQVPFFNHLCNDKAACHEDRNTASATKTREITTNDVTLPPRSVFIPINSNASLVPHQAVFRLLIFVLVVVRPP